MKLSIVIPVYEAMPDGDVLLKRCLKSIKIQTFKDYEVVVTTNGGWAENHNSAIRECKGELIKFLHMDDYFTDKNSLKRIVNAYKGGWLITGCDNNPNPFWTNDIWRGNNKLGGPSCLLIENKDPLLFDESMTWLVDCDYYYRLRGRYGEPTLLNEVNVNIGIHEGQATNQITDIRKAQEHLYIRRKHGK